VDPTPAPATYPPGERDAAAGAGPTDAELLARMAAGDEQALGMFYDAGASRKNGADARILRDHAPPRHGPRRWRKRVRRIADGGLEGAIRCG
jgi:hypothetical protein